jgi:hypothetical protein
MVCIDTHTDYKNPENQNQENIYHQFNGRDIRVARIDYHQRLQGLNEQHFLNAGEATYVISTIDEANKYSRDYFDCTGLVVTGIDKETGRNISFLTHQDPKKFLKKKKEEFVADLNRRLEEMRSRCVSGTIDAVIVGGNYDEDESEKKISFAKNYLDSISLLTDEVKKSLGFEPIIINGPKTTLNQDDVFCDNEHRRLYFLRPAVNNNTQSFNNSEINKEKKKWDEQITSKTKKDKKNERKLGQTEDGWESFYNT